MYPEESPLARLMIPDLLTSEQYYDGVPHPATEAIRRLMLAVLEDALRCLQMRANGRSSVVRRAVVEAECWIFERGLQGPFTFESVCEALGIHPDHLRGGIRQWRAQLSGVGHSQLPRLQQVRRSVPAQSFVLQQ